MTYQYDLFTIGAGSGGVRASRMSSGFGAKVAVAEGRFLGGTCVNVGCVPKKLMVYASHFQEEVHDAAGYGWTFSKGTFDWGTFITRKDAEIKRLNGIYERILTSAGTTIHKGYATLMDRHTIEVKAMNGDINRYTAKNILLATGGKVDRPTIPGAEHCLISDDIFELREMPKKIIIVGGGYIAIEFAGIFQGLGAEVSLVHRGAQFLKGFDDEVRGFLAKELQKKGIRLLFSNAITHVERRGEQRIASLQNGEMLEADAVLYAIGRSPHIDGLGLEKVGVKCNERGAVLVDEDYRTSVDNIYALGDVIERINLTPVALAEGMAVARQLFGGVTHRVDYTDVATAVFSQPTLATVGVTETQAKEKFGELEVYATEFTSLKHTLSGNKERTFMKLIVAKQSRVVVGVHMVGADAPEIIQMASIALKCKATKEQFDATIGIHPTAAEEFVTMRTKRSA
jgi:glutathione reductase (NADPH)